MYLSISAYILEKFLYFTAFESQQKVFSRQKFKYIWFWKRKQTADFVNKQLKVNVARFARNVVLNETFLVTFKHCVFSSVFEDYWLKRQNSKELVF